MHLGSGNGREAQFRIKSLFLFSRERKFLQQLLSFLPTGTETSFQGSCHSWDAEGLSRGEGGRGERQKLSDIL